MCGVHREDTKGALIISQMFLSKITIFLALCGPACRRTGFRSIRLGWRWGRGAFGGRAALNTSFERCGLMPHDKSVCCARQQATAARCKRLFIDLTFSLRIRRG